MGTMGTGAGIGDANGTERRAGRLATAGAAVGFVAPVAVTLVVALFTRSWDGFEALAIPPLVLAWSFSPCGCVF